MAFFPDKYTTYAKIVPAALSAVPAAFVLNRYAPELGWLVALNAQIATIARISPVLLAVYPIMEAARLLGKLYEGYLFRSGQGMPTTDLLMHADVGYSANAKRDVAVRVSRDFGIALADEVEERTDPEEARRLIVEAVALIRRKVGKTPLTHQYLIQYGFWRNLVGGSVFGFAVSYAECWWAITHPGSFPLSITVVMLALYSAVLAFGGCIIRGSGRHYARYLLDDYRSLN